MRFVLNHPQHNAAGADPDGIAPIAELARRAEVSGWAGFALTEHPIPGARWNAEGGHDSFDPFVGLAFAAAVTTRLRLLTYLAVLPYRNPLLLAKAAATLDAQSGGRLILGVGAGYQRSEFAALGVDYEERNALFDEALDVLPLAFRGEPFSFEGRHFQARDVVARPTPAQDPIPVWIGGNSRLTRRRVIERAQGWMPFVISAEASRAVGTAALGSVDALRDTIAATRTEAGERPIDVALPYPDRTIAEVDRDVERHRDAMGTLEAAGVNWLVLNAPARRTAEFVTEFGETHIPRAEDGQ